MASIAFCKSLPGRVNSMGPVTTNAGWMSLAHPQRLVLSRLPFLGRLLSEQFSKKLDEEWSYLGKLKPFGLTVMALWIP